MKKIVVQYILTCFLSASLYAQTFTNPLLPSGADPWVIQKNGIYYYTHTTGGNITLWKTDNLANLESAERKLVYEPPPGMPYSRNMWAPELHFINGKWYVYFAADDGNNNNHRMYVIENDSPDPLQGGWTFKGKVTDATDKWAIDGSVFRYRRKWYMIWAGWEGDINGRQDIYIARLKNPWTVKGSRARISSPVYDWEKNDNVNNSGGFHVYVNEGPQILANRKKLFLIYSASGCWTDFYALGMLSFKGRRNLLDSARWIKSGQPVFRQSPENSVYAPGHNTFFKSPDGKEDWILYHANNEPGQGCGRFRSPRAQKFTWNEDGSPNFGVPVKTGAQLPIPSGKEEKKVVAE